MTEEQEAQRRERKRLCDKACQARRAPRKRPYVPRSQMSPAKLAAMRANDKRYDKSGHRKRKPRAEFTERELEAARAAEARYRARQRSAPKPPRPAPKPTGSVLATAAASRWRDVLALLTDRVPRIECREDIIAEAALRMVEGAGIEEALADARRAVFRDRSHMWRAVPVDECFWL